MTSGMIFICESPMGSSFNGAGVISGTDFSSTIRVSFWIVGSGTFSFNSDISFLGGRGGAGTDFIIASRCSRGFRSGSIHSLICGGI